MSSVAWPCVTAALISGPTGALARTGCASSSASVVLQKKRQAMVCTGPAGLMRLKGIFDPFDVGVVQTVEQDAVKTTRPFGLPWEA